MNTKAFCILSLLLVLAVIVETSAQQDDSALRPSLSLTALADSCGAMLEYDPLTRSGMISARGRVVSFVVGAPWILLDWKQLRQVSAPSDTGASVEVARDFADVVMAYFAEPEQRISKYTVKAIVIDPGHGGRDPGAIGEFDTFRIQEKDINLQIALRTAELLRLRYPDRQVLLTRDQDMYPSLEERVEMANAIRLRETEAVIYVSIHSNASFNRNSRGYEVWYLNPEYRRTVVDERILKEKGEDLSAIINTMLEEEFTTESIILAQKVYQSMGSMLGTFTEGRGIRAEEWFVVRNARMPSILIEAGFVTNREEATLLANPSYLRRIADAIYNGIVGFIDHFER